MTTALDVEIAAHSGAFGFNEQPTPTEWQLKTGNYRKGHIVIQGLAISIEQPRNSIRTGRDRNGKEWSSRMAAHYGYFDGTKGADGDEVDVFIGQFPESDVVFIFNQYLGGRFDEHKVMLGFPGIEMAEAAYLNSYTRGWGGSASYIQITVSQLRWWLSTGNKAGPACSSHFPLEDMRLMQSSLVRWSSAGDSMPTNKSLPQLMYELNSADRDDQLLMDAITIPEILADADDAMILDALVVAMGGLEQKMKAMMAVMNRAGTAVQVTAVQVSDPFTKGGNANVAVVFELSDGQTVSIFLHNPDTTPRKITSTDQLISWRWLLNKKDISIVVAPEKGTDLNVREVARRIMKLADKNSAAFTRANSKRAERMASIDSLKTEVAGLEKELEAAQKDLELAKIEAEEAESAKVRQSENDAAKAAAIQGMKSFSYYNKNNESVIGYAKFVAGDRVQQVGDLHYAGTVDMPVGVPDQWGVVREFMVEWDQGGLSRVDDEAIQALDDDVQKISGGDGRAVGAGSPAARPTGEDIAKKLELLGWSASQEPDGNWVVSYGRGLGTTVYIDQDQSGAVEVDGDSPPSLTKTSGEIASWIHEQWAVAGGNYDPDVQREKFGLATDADDDRYRSDQFVASLSVLADMVKDNGGLFNLGNFDFTLSKGLFDDAFSGGDLLGTTDIIAQIGNARTRDGVGRAAINHEGAVTLYRKLSGADVVIDKSRDWIEIQDALRGLINSGLGGKSEQYISYKKWIDSGKKLSPGIIEQIKLDERLNDGEAEELLSLDGVNSQPGNEGWSDQQIADAVIPHYKAMAENFKKAEAIFKSVLMEHDYEQAMDSYNEAKKLLVDSDAIALKRLMDKSAQYVGIIRARAQLDIELTKLNERRAEIVSMRKSQKKDLLLEENSRLIEQLYENIGKQAGVNGYELAKGQPEEAIARRIEKDAKERSGYGKAYTAAMAARDVADDMLVDLRKSKDKKSASDAASMVTADNVDQFISAIALPEEVKKDFRFIRYSDFPADRITFDMLMNPPAGSLWSGKVETSQGFGANAGITYASLMISTPVERADGVVFESVHIRASSRGASQVDYGNMSTLWKQNARYKALQTMTASERQFLAVVARKYLPLMELSSIPNSEAAFLLLLLRDHPSVRHYQNELTYFAKAVDATGLAEVSLQEFTENTGSVSDFIKLAFRNMQGTDATTQPLASNPDRDFLQSMVAGTADFEAADLAEKLEDIYNRNQSDTDLMALFEKAVNAYQDAMLAATANLK